MVSVAFSVMTPSPCLVYMPIQVDGTRNDAHCPAVLFITAQNTYFFEMRPVDTMYQLLIQKGYFTEAEFLEKMKVVQRDY
jgi:hypothetical protein